MWKYIPYQGQAFTYRFSTRMNRRMDDDLVHTKLNHHPTKMDILPKTFIQIIPAATYRYMAGAAFKYVCPPNSSDDLCLLFCLLLLLWMYPICFYR